MNEQWTVEMDAALTHLLNSLCRVLAISPARLHPHEIYIREEELTSQMYTPLQGEFLSFFFPTGLHPHKIYIWEEELASQMYKSLQGKFSLLKCL